MNEMPCLRLKRHDDEHAIGQSGLERAPPEGQVMAITHCGNPPFSM